MSVSTIRLGLALHAEHKARTSHDITRQTKPEYVTMLVIQCPVCMHLRALMDEAERMSCPPEPDTAFNGKDH